MKNYNLAFLGFGNVGRALVQLLESKRGELRERYGVEFALTGVASRPSTSFAPRCKPGCTW